MLLALAVAIPSSRSRAANDWTALTVGPTAWSSPVVGDDGYLLALARDRAGVRLVRLPLAGGAPALPPDAAPSALVEASSEHEITAIARGARSDRLIVIRRATREDRDELVALGATAETSRVLFAGGVGGERLADPVMSPDGESIALVARREPRARGQTVSTRVLVVPAQGGPPQTIATGDDDRASPAFVATESGGRALAFVRVAGEYSLWTRVPIAADGSPAGAEEVANRDRAAWRSVVPVDAAGRHLLVARDLGHGPALWLVETGSMRAELVTAEGRAAFAPALTPDAREAVFVGARLGGVNLFRVPLAGDRAPRALDGESAGTRSVASSPFDDESDFRGERVFDEARAARLDQECRACHDHERGLEVVGRSAHAKLACTDCHVDVTETPHRSIARSERVAAPLDGRGRPVTDDGSPRAATGAGLRGVGERVTQVSAASLACGSCHRPEAVSWRQDVHGQAFDARSAAAPGCPTCHGDHDVRKLGDAGSQVARTRIATGCTESCHSGAWDVVSATGDGEAATAVAYRSDPLATYRESIHAKKLRLGKRDAATCASCHTAHAVLNAAHPDSSLNPAKSAATCAANGKCHVGADANYVTLVDHVVAVPHGKTPRQHVHLAISLVGVGTVAWAGGDALLDALRRVTRWARRRKGATK
ncbi:MAG: hypothetical protein U0610_17245 [bacterium]